MDSSLLELLATVAEGGSLAGRAARVREGSAVTTVVASRGYPGAYAKGKRIEIPSDLERDDLMIFHASTEGSADGLVTSGGRVLSVTALADTFAEAVDASREGAGRVGFDGAFFRSDIGWREQARIGVA
jgi:phosphoribosylamine--glycine ligase